MAFRQPKICIIGLTGVGWSLAALITNAGYPIVVSESNRCLLDAFCRQTGSEALEPAKDLPTVEIVISLLNEPGSAAPMLVGAYGMVKLLQPRACAITMQGSTGCQALSSALARHSLEYLCTELPTDFGQTGISAATTMFAGAESAMLKCSGLLSVLGTPPYVGALTDDAQGHRADAPY